MAHTAFSVNPVSAAINAKAYMAIPMLVWTGRAAALNERDTPGYKKLAKPNTNCKRQL